MTNSPSKLITDSLGFALTVSIEVCDISPNSGTHRVFENVDTGRVPADALHTLKIQRGLSMPYLAEVIAHEVYHLFYSVRHLISVDEETEAEVFGQLVRHVHEVVAASS